MVTDNYTPPTGPISLSCSDWSFPLLQHEQALDLIAALGFTGVDVMLRGNKGGSHIFPEDVVQDVPAWAGRLEERAGSRGLEISDIFWIPWTGFEVMAPNNPDSAEMERGRAMFNAMLELAVRLDAPGLTVLPGIDWPHETHEESLTRAAVELGQRAAQVRDRGLRFSIEPSVGSLCHSPGDAARLCELAPGLELTLDYTHYVSRGFSEVEIDPLLPLARHLHARGGADERLQAPMAANTIDYERLIDELDRAGYDGYLTVEYVWVEWENLNDVDVLSETIMMRNRLRAKLVARPGPVGIATPGS